MGDELKKLKIIDLFAGIGGIRKGFEEYFGECVFSSEWDKHAQITYKENYGEIPEGDITKIDEKNIPEFDIILAGFPCQPFSHAGLKKGFEDTRGTLFFDVARIIAASTISPVVVSNIVNPSTAAPASARRPSIPATPKPGIIRTSIARSINPIIIRVIISDILFRFNYIFNSNSGSSGCY